MVRTCPVSLLFWGKNTIVYTVIVYPCFFYTCDLPDNFQNTVGYDEHFSSHFSLSAYQISGREYVSFHFQDQVVEELGLALLEYCYLDTKTSI